MFLAHYGPALLIKFLLAGEEISLGWLFVAVQLPDIVHFSTTLLCENTGIILFCFEDCVFKHDLVLKDGVSPFYTDGPLTHGLSGNILLSLFLALLFSLLEKNRKISFVKTFYYLFLGVVSHYLLDVLTHRGDMYVLYPFDGLRVGFELWNIGKGPYFFVELIVSLVPVFVVYNALVNNKVKISSTWKTANIVYIVLTLIVSYVYLFAGESKLDLPDNYPARKLSEWYKGLVVYAIFNVVAIYLNNPIESKKSIN
ncbi:hypothetical protein ABK040_015637 [Willaertia magna]